MAWNVCCGELGGSTARTRHGIVRLFKVGGGREGFVG